MKAVFLDTDSLAPADLDLSALKACFSQLQLRGNTQPEELTAAIADAEVVISNKVVIDRETLSQARSLKLICVAATGSNNIDIDAAHELGIAVCNARGYATHSVVQHVFALITALNTKLLRYQDTISNGDWQQSEFFALLDYPIQDLHGQTLGIVGYGELGKAVAKVAEAFGMHVIVAKGRGSDGERVELNQLFSEADIISLHCPLSIDNSHFVNADKLSRMKPTALLINTARGGLINEVDLATALTSGQIAAAGVDVLSQEPPTDDNPLIKAKLDNLIITPHIAWASQSARQRLVNELVKNIEAYSRGQQRNQL
jgi:glycerate dehydrogenase